MAGNVAHGLMDEVKVSGNAAQLLAVVREAIAEDLRVEDELDAEVREILEGHAVEMRRTGAQYHEMFKMIKKKLVRERRLIL